MKKFLLSSVLVLLVVGAFAQQCPIDFKRNNGNGGGTAGNITFTFATAPNPLLYVTKIVEIGTANEAIIAGNPSFKNNSVTYGFQSNNLGPAGNLLVYFFIDLDGDKVLDLNEIAYTCNLTPQGPLPVSLVKFNASTRGNGISLTWETATELNNQGFDVERRSANGQYEKIGFVASKAVGGNGFDQSYSFEDNSTQTKGVTYYRLRQVDLDGKATFSEIRGVRTGKGLIVLSVYPNPSRGTTNVAIPSGIGSVDVSVDDFTGKSVQRFVGVTTSNLQLTNLKPGIYMVRVTVRATGEVISEKIAVQ